MAFRPANPGHAFRNGKLYSFSSSSIEVIRPWGPGAGAWEKTTKAPGWKGVRPSLRISEMEQTAVAWPMSVQTVETLDEEGRPIQIQVAVPPGYPERQAAAYAGFLALIPVEVRRALRPFYEANWELLRLAQSCGAPFLDLAGSIPALAFALAIRRRLRTPIGPSATIARLLRRRQREIAGKLGFPPTESTVRILRRIPARTLSFWRIYHLRRALADDLLARRLQFAPRLNASVLRLLSGRETAALVTPAFIDEVSRLRSELRTPALARAVIELRQIQAAVQHETTFPLRTTRALALQHDHVVANLGSEPLSAFLARVGPFPPPPFPGKARIEPIATPEELWAEGRAMNHCVAGYADRVETGTTYFYRVMGPERATVALQKKGDYWTLSEVHGPSNRQISHDAYCEIAAWYSESAYEANEALPGGEDDRQQAFEFEEVPF